MADVLMVSRTTLWLTFSSYTDISDSDLDGVMEALVRKNPKNGIVMMWGHLRSINIFVTRKRVYESLHRVSPDMIEHRRSNAIYQRVYNESNSLWHIDGLHCLICDRI